MEFGNSNRRKYEKQYGDRYVGWMDGWMAYLVLPKIGRYTVLSQNNINKIVVVTFPNRIK